MGLARKFCDLMAIFIFLVCLNECSRNVFLKIDKKYFLASEAYSVAKNLFLQGRNNYDMLKNKSLHAIDTFLDLVQIMNNEMARELRSAIIKFYRIKYFHDFTNYVISMDEMINITEHCLIDPIEKLEEIRLQFHSVIHNFEDVRNFNTVNKCNYELPDEVAASHCILNQAVLFNETMAETLVTIVEIKTRQHAQDMNGSLYNVERCLRNFVPKFFEQLLIDAYTTNCTYLRIVNASMTDLINDKWRLNQTVFPTKWAPVVRLLKERLQVPTQGIKEPLVLTLFAANLTSDDIMRTMY